MSEHPAARTLVDQPGAAPTRKVAGGGFIGGVAVLALVALSAVGVDVPGVDPEALPVGEVVVWLITTGSAWAVRERRQPPSS